MDGQILSPLFMECAWYAGVGAFSLVAAFAGASIITGSHDEPYNDIMLPDDDGRGFPRDPGFAPDRD